MSTSVEGLVNFNHHPERQTRIAALDRLRVIANLGRLSIHAAVPYMWTHTGMWPLYDMHSSRAFDALVYLIHSFANELFFFLSGYFAWHMLHRYGGKNFLRNRSYTILVPFLAGLFILIPLIVSCFSYVDRFMGPNATAFQWHKLVEANLNFIQTYGYPLANLWFLYYLLMCYTLWLIGRWAIQRLYVKVSWPRWVWMSVSLVHSISMLLCMQSWHRDTPLFFPVQWPVLFYFLNYFLIGVRLATSPTLVQICQKQYRLLLWTGLLLTLVGLGLQVQFPRIDLPFYSWIRVSAILIFSVQSAALVLGLIGLTHSLSPVARLWVSFLAKASYWTSYIELPVVMVVHIMLASLDISIFFKFMLSIGVILLTALLSFRYLVSQTGLRHFFGTYLPKTIPHLSREKHHHNRRYRVPG